MTTEDSPKLCACGCGQHTLRSYSSGRRNGDYNTYLHGHQFTGIPKSPEHKHKLSEANKANPSKYWLGKKMPEAARMAMRKPKGPQSLEHIAKCAALRRGKKRPATVIAALHNRVHTPESRMKRRLAQLGSKGSGWKGGISPINECIRQSLEFSLWRETVLQRDNYTCRQCGYKHANGRRRLLIPHHIKKFADFPQLRFAIHNGITLCFDCHKPTIGHEQSYELIFENILQGYGGVQCQKVSSMKQLDVQGSLIA